MARVRRNEGIGHTKKTLLDDSGDLEGIEGLLSYLPQDPTERFLDFLRLDSAEEHRLYFRSHEKEVPSGAANLAIQDEAI